jgi:hypothetical protein
MKYLFLLLLTLTFNSAKSQILPKFELTIDGVEAIIVNIDSTDSKTIYSKSKNWIQEFYKNPDEVLKTNIENEKLRVNGFKKDAWHYKSLGYVNSYDLEYTFEIDIKDNKIRLTFTPGQSWAGNQKVEFTYKTFYNKKDELKNVYKEAKSSFEESMNEIVLSLYNYIKNKKSDW